MASEVATSGRRDRFRLATIASVATEPAKDAQRRSLVSRLRERNGDDRPHYERTFRKAGLAGAAALALVMSDDMACGCCSNRPSRRWPS
jgi:hypothetical protein